MKILIEAGHGNPPLTGIGSKQSPDGRLKEYVYCREIAREVVRPLRVRACRLASGLSADRSSKRKTWPRTRR